MLSYLGDVLVRELGGFGLVLSIVEFELKTFTWPDKFPPSSLKSAPIITWEPSPDKEIDFPN